MLKSEHPTARRDDLENFSESYPGREHETIEEQLVTAPRPQDTDWTPSGPPASPAATFDAVGHWADAPTPLYSGDAPLLYAGHLHRARIEAART